MPAPRGAGADSERRVQGDGPIRKRHVRTRNVHCPRNEGGPVTGPAGPDSDLFRLAYEPPISLRVLRLGERCKKCSREAELGCEVYS